jgi:SAM-dependent methyltransferase
LSVANIYRALGVDYVAIDVDPSYGAVFFDLNTFSPPPHWIGTFDMLNNEGTIEHPANPINGFQVAHELLKVGGVACHSMPMIGHVKHGLFNPTPKLWSDLMLANRYETLAAVIELQEDDPEFGFTGFEVHDRTGSRVSHAAMMNAWAHVAYRKTSDAQFVIPTDHLNFPLGQVVTRELRSNHERYAGFRLEAKPSNWRSKAGVPASIISVLKFVLWKMYVHIRLSIKPPIPRR